jgi:peptidoglycan/LPS O-acetylase OafA/YrhL
MVKAAGQRGIRLTRLDGLRGIAALGVALYHMASWPHLHPAVAWPLNWLFAWGWTLVDLFFVLSGYVFAHVYGAPGQLNRPGALEDFWVARVARLWPLHLVTLALFAIFAWGGDNSLKTLPWHLLLLQGFNPAATEAFNSVSWSVSIELACYTLFCLSARAGDRVLLVVSLLTVLACAARLAVMGHAEGIWTGLMLPRGGLGFFLGQLLWRGRGAFARVSVSILVLAASLGFWFNDTAVGALLPLTVLAWGPAVLLALRFRWLDARPIAWLGERSFGLYMVHMPVLQAVDTLWPPHGLSPTGLAVSQTAIALLCLLAAELAYRLIEVPGRAAIRARWLTRQRKDMDISAQLA